MSAESGKAQPEGPDFPPLPEVWMVDWVASKTGEHYQEFHDSESGALLTAAQLAAATPAMPARITQLNPDPVRAALVEALTRLHEACDDSDGSCYGTLSTSFVRGICTDALKAAGEGL